MRGATQASRLCPELMTDVSTSGVGRVCSRSAFGRLSPPAVTFQLTAPARCPLSLGAPARRDPLPPFNLQESRRSTFKVRGVSILTKTASQSRAKPATDSHFKSATISRGKSATGCGRYWHTDFRARRHQMRRCDRPVLCSRAALPNMWCRCSQHY